MYLTSSDESNALDKATRGGTQACAHINTYIVLQSADITVQAETVKGGGGGGGGGGGTNPTPTLLNACF